MLFYTYKNDNLLHIYQQNITKILFKMAAYRLLDHYYKTKCEISGEDAS